MRDKLIELIREGANGHTFMPVERIANHLIANGVTLQQPAGPLTFEEVLEHLDEPVWLKDLKEPALSHWGIVEGDSVLDGAQYLYLHGEPGHYCYGESVVAYLHKPKEVQ